MIFTPSNLKKSCFGKFFFQKQDGHWDLGQKFWIFILRFLNTGNVELLHLKNGPKLKISPPRVILGQNSKTLRGDVWRTNNDKMLKFSGFLFLYGMVTTR